MERNQATELVHNLLRGMISQNASDLFVTAGFPPAFKVDGKMTPVSSQVLTAQHTQELARSIMNDRQVGQPIVSEGVGVVPGFVDDLLGIVAHRDCLMTCTVR